MASCREARQVLGPADSLKEWPDHFHPLHQLPHQQCEGGVKDDPLEPRLELLQNRWRRNTNEMLDQSCEARGNAGVRNIFVAIQNSPKFAPSIPFMTSMRIACSDDVVCWANDQHAAHLKKLLYQPPQPRLDFRDALLYAVVQCLLVQPLCCCCCNCCRLGSLLLCCWLLCHAIQSRS